MNIIKCRSVKKQDADEPEDEDEEGEPSECLAAARASLERSVIKISLLFISTVQLP